jgi:hypothetical protein
MNHRTVNYRSAIKQPVANTGFAQTDTDLRGERKQPFLEDFNMEHSSSNVAVKLIAFSAAAEAMEAATPRSGYGSSTNLPSCIYLG